MGRLLSGHPLSGAILVITLALAMTVELVARAPARATRRVAGTADVGDVARFAGALGTDSIRRSIGPAAVTDPFDAPREESGVEPAGAPMVAPPAARLTAILIADHGSVAVIDDEAVSVGGTLRTGERVASIQQDRVWI